MRPKWIEFEKILNIMIESRASEALTHTSGEASSKRCRLVLGIRDGEGSVCGRKESKIRSYLMTILFDFRFSFRRRNFHRDAALERCGSKFVRCTVILFVRFFLQI